jgi:hypothetical protein
MNTLLRSFMLMTVACLVTLTTSLRADNQTGRGELDTLLAQYDGETDESVRDTLAARIDTIAHQKYATVSRLYWYVNIEAAKAAAREEKRPILHLRMLGSLADDLSCANSRLFRATLYANHELSEFLRTRFVLYWSSERPVPRVTIDYGDGRILERTTAGNSAHYVLDEHGNVLDVIPGLYAPAAFRHELENSLNLAAAVRDTSDSERARLVSDYHSRLAASARRDWERFASTPSMSRLRQGLTQPRNETSLAAAQRATMTKMAIEVRDLRVFAAGLAPEAVRDDQVELWSTAGQQLYGLDVMRQVPRSGRAMRETPGLLDDASRTLVVRLHNAGSPRLLTSGEALSAMIARLEQSIAADTALNQLRLRPQISREIVRENGRIEFSALNSWIYAQVFHTPTEDAWLGLLPRDVFTGLPGDGVVFKERH